MTWKCLFNSKKDDLKLSFYDSVKFIHRSDWEAVSGEKNIYLKLDYLKALEDSLTDKMEFRYVIFYDENDIPVSIAAVQILEFTDANYNREICSLSKSLKSKLLPKLDLKVMVCGNVFATGENGFAYTTGISSEKAYENLAKGLHRLRKSESVDGKVSIMLVKEFKPETYTKSDMLLSGGFKGFRIDVNMVLKIHSEWKTFEDYLESMVTKFRTKAKNVLKKSGEIKIVNFKQEDIQTYEKDLEVLYTSVVRNAEFSFGKLSEASFNKFKENLGDQFVIKGYFLREQLVGFSTAFVNNKIIDAGYVGIDYKYNKTYAIYQRILYDYVQLAIDNNTSELHLGRTAEEIKSTLGATPTDLKLYIKHKNVISNQLLKPIIESITPGKFELRNPFKASFSYS